MRASPILLTLVVAAGCQDGAAIRGEPGDTADSTSPEVADIATPDGGSEDTSEVSDAPYPEIYVRDTWGYEIVAADPELVGGTCGVTPVGYDGCRLEIAPGWESTLCDEARGRCVPPIADCADGWCYVPPRSYLSGAASDGVGHSVDAAITVVPRGFYVQETEFTEGDFADWMGYRSPFRTACGDDCPVTGVSVFEAMEVANRMSDDAKLSRCYVLTDCDWITYYSFYDDPADLWVCAESTFVGPECTGYRLPSRAEWELAARGGSPYCRPRGPQLIGSSIGACDLDDPEAVKSFDLLWQRRRRLQTLPHPPGLRPKWWRGPRRPGVPRPRAVEVDGAERLRSLRGPRQRRRVHADPVLGGAAVRLQRSLRHVPTIPVRAWTGVRSDGRADVDAPPRGQLL